jgi:hypothetical protein
MHLESCFIIFLTHLMTLQFNNFTRTYTVFSFKLPRTRISYTCKDKTVINVWDGLVIVGSSCLVRGYRFAEARSARYIAMCCLCKSIWHVGMVSVIIHSNVIGLAHLGMYRMISSIIWENSIALFSLVSPWYGSAPYPQSKSWVSLPDGPYCTPGRATQWD